MTLESSLLDSLRFVFRETLQDVDGVERNRKSQRNSEIIRIVCQLESLARLLADNVDNIMSARFKQCY